MERPGYERFALVSNPFHDLASESLEQIEVYHVNQASDEAFERMKQEVLEKARKAFVIVVGPLGSGKTQRLRVTLSQAAGVEAYAHYLNLGEAPPNPVAAIAEALAKGAADRKLIKGFSPPPWAKDLQAMAKGKPINPETAGRVLAEALNALAPCYLLLNDVDALHGQTEARTLQTLLALVSHQKQGTMVVLTCQQPHFAELNRRFGPLMSRVNRTLELTGMTDGEAEILIAKRMAGRRLIEDLDPVYPFTKDAVAEINRVGGGSPRRLLQLADLVLDSAVKERAFQIGPELVLSSLGRAGSLVDNKPVTSAPILRPQPMRPMPLKSTPVQPMRAQPMPVQRMPVPGALRQPQSPGPRPAAGAAPANGAQRATAPPPLGNRPSLPRPGPPLPPNAASRVAPNGLRPNPAQVPPKQATPSPQSARAAPPAKAGQTQKK